MRGESYYQDPSYHEYLLSVERSELFPPKKILAQLEWKGIDNLLDFGMGNGYFLPHFYAHLPEHAHVWGAECQESLIDRTLRLKIDAELERFIPFYIDRTEHPLLPDWIPSMDMIFCSCVLSTFADPTQALNGIARGMTSSGTIVIIDWEKKECSSGPEITQKISRDRMNYFLEDAGFYVQKKLEINEYVYGMSIRYKKEDSPAE